MRLARELGVANFGKLSIDGTKVRANASKRKAMSYGRMVEEESRLAGEIEGLLGRAAEVDERYGEENRGDELPAELPRQEDRLTAIRAAKERLEEARRKADDAGGRRPEWKRNPQGGRPYKRDYGAGGDGAKQLHGSGERDHEDEFGGLPTVLQRAGGGAGQRSTSMR